MFLLQCRTSYSDPGAPTPEELAERAAQQELGALAVTELDTLDSVVECQEAFQTHGLSPVVGLEWAGIGGDERLLFYARTLEGYRELIGLLSRPIDATSPEPDFGLKSLPDGLFVLCNPPDSLLRSLISKAREREALMMVQRYMEWFGRRALRVVLPPDPGENLGEAQRMTLGILAREGLRFVTLGCNETTGEPLSEEALTEAYQKCPAAVQESEQLLDACEFRWEPPSGGLAQVNPGRGYRSESFVWDRCHQVLVSEYGNRRREAEKRLYREFQAFRDADLFDLLVALTQVQGKTSLGHPLVWPVNGWVVSTLVGHLLGLCGSDPLRLKLEPEIPEADDSEAHGIDVTLHVGRGEWKRCIEALEGIFGKDHVVFRRGKPVGRPPAETGPDLFSEELSIEQRATPPVIEILVSRFRWLDFLPATETENGHLETTLPSKVIDRLPLYRFRLRRDKLLTILTLGARDVSHQGRRLDLFAEPDEVFRFLTGSDGGRGILRLGVRGLSSVDSYLRLRKAALANTGFGKRTITLDDALDRVAEAFSSEEPHVAERMQRLILAHKLMAAAALCLNYPRSYYMALFSTVGLEMEELRKTMAEVMSRGIRVSGPDINESEADTIITEEGIRLGLRCIRGIGPVISNSLIGSRERQPFISLQDLCRRTDRRTVNRMVLNRLIEFGALDNLQGDREAQKAALAWILGGDEREGLHPRQLSLFGQPGAAKFPHPKKGIPGSIGKREPRPAWEVFDAESLESGGRLFGDTGAERVTRLKEGGPRWVVAWGWFLDIFPSSERSRSPWGFFSDGESMTPILLSCDGIDETPSGPWVIRGRCEGNRSEWFRFLPHRLKPSRPSPPDWLADLPVIDVLDMEPVAQAVKEISARSKLHVRVGQGERRGFQELVQCIRSFQVKGDQGAALRFEGDPGWSRRRRLRRLTRRPILLPDIALRWLQSIPVVLSVHTEDGEGFVGADLGPAGSDQKAELQTSRLTSEPDSSNP